MRTSTRFVGAIAEPAVRAGSVLTGHSTALTLVGWHRFGEADDGLTTRMEDFRRHLDVLQAWGATVLPLEEAHRLLAGGALPDKAVCLTFDDGYASVVEQAWPELQRRGMPATLFAVSGYLRGGDRFPWDANLPSGSDLSRLVNAGDLQHAAASGLHVGSHTVTHRWLPALPAHQVREELGRSRDDLEDLLGRPVTSFAYPMGGLTPRIRDDVEAAGYQIAITTERGRNGTGHDPITLRRAFAFDRARDLRRQLDGAFTWMRLLERRRNRREPRW